MTHQQEMLKMIKRNSILNGIFTSVFLFLALIFSNQDEKKFYLFLGIFIILEIFYIYYFYKKLKKFKEKIEK